MPATWRWIWVFFFIIRFVKFPLHSKYASFSLLFYVKESSANLHIIIDFFWFKLYRKGLIYGSVNLEFVAFNTHYRGWLFYEACKKSVLHLLLFKQRCINCVIVLAAGPEKRKTIHAWCWSWYFQLQSIASILDAASANSSAWKIQSSHPQCWTLPFQCKSLQCRACQLSYPFQLNQNANASKRFTIFILLQFAVTRSVLLRCIIDYDGINRVPIASSVLHICWYMFCELRSLQPKGTKFHKAEKKTMKINLKWFYT